MTTEFETLPQGDLRLLDTPLAHRLLGSTSPARMAYTGPDGTPRDYEGSLDGTPVFLGSADPDFHIPVARVDETERVLTRMGAKVTKRIYPGMGHTVNEDEIEHVRGMMEEVAG